MIAALNIVRSVKLLDGRQAGAPARTTIPGALRSCVASLPCFDGPRQDTPAREISATHQVRRHSACGEFRAIGEAQQRTEAVGRRGADDEHSRHRGLELTAEHGRALNDLHLPAQLRRDEGQPVKVDAIAGGGNDMIDVDPRFSAVGLRERQSYSPIDRLGARHARADMHR